MKFHRSLAALAIVAAALVPGVTSRSTVDPPPAGVTISGVDAHDGTIYKDGTTYYLVGTRYSCPAGNFNWLSVPTTFCGFSVFTAPALAGPWTFVRTLFPVSDVSPYNHTTWQHTCGDEGIGCFNPRMIQRGDGVWVLWFNAPYDTVHFSANAYYVMGCNGPAGPCGSSAGAPYGSVSKPAVYKCTGAGDFSLIPDGTSAWITCNLGGSYPLVFEKLDSCFCNGINVGAVTSVTGIEGPGAFKAADGTWIATFSDPACGYCGGTGTGYAVAPTLSGPWTWAGNPNLGSGDMTARRKISANSCGGQPRTVITVDDQRYQYIDLWYGSPNEALAGIRLEPLVPTPPYTNGTNGSPWVGGLKPFTCN